MSADELALLATTADALFAGVDRDDPTAAWAALERQGMTRVGLETGSVDYLAVLLRAAGRAAVSVPLVETHVAATLLEGAALPDPGGALAVAIDPACLGLAPRRRMPVRLAGVPAVAVTVDGSGRVSCHDVVDAAGPSSGHTRNLAGEPIALLDLASTGAGGPAVRCAPDLVRDAALLWLIGRAASMVGAGERALEQTMGYVAEREQFGRTLAKFQAVQQTVAVMASEVAAASVAVSAAFAVLSDGAGEPARFAAFAAATQAGRMATVVTRSAHQLHGAIGFTEEHSLRYATTRLTAWRSSVPVAADLDAALGSIAFETAAAWQPLTAL